MDSSEYIRQFLEETRRIAETINQQQIAEAIELLRSLRQREGRLFILGVGGSAGNASHAVNDFRKIAQIETYAPTDNVSELTAWVNDASWEAVFINWLKESHLRPTDMLLIYSVGGGSPTTIRLTPASKCCQRVLGSCASSVARK